MMVAYYYLRQLAQYPTQTICMISAAHSYRDPWLWTKGDRFEKIKKQRTLTCLKGIAGSKIIFNRMKCHIV